MNELLTQLNALIADAEANKADADNWRALVDALQGIGYGPRIQPHQIAALVPEITMIQEIVAATQEAPAPGAPKRGGMPRRKLTADDIGRVDQLAHQGFTTQQIAGELGVARSAVTAYLGHD